MSLIDPAWQKIQNPFPDLPRYNCYVCAPGNPQGFKCEFYYDPGQDLVLSVIPEPGQVREGFPGILHGGFQAMLLDEIMIWAVYRIGGRISFTGSMEVKFSKTLYIDRPLVAKGRVIRSSKRLFGAEGWLESGGEVKCRGTGTYVVPTWQDFTDLIGTTDIPDHLAKMLR